MDWNQYFLQGLELLFLGTGTFFDVKDKELPVLYLQIFGGLGILCNLLWKYQSPKEFILGSAIGGSFLVLGRLNDEAIGYGDGIGLAILGAFEGFEGMIPIVTAAFLFSGIYGLWALFGVKKSGSDTMPFFPFLLLAFMGVELI